MSDDPFEYTSVPHKFVKQSYASVGDKEMGRELTMDGVKRQIEEVLQAAPRDDLVQRLRSVKCDLWVGMDNSQSRPLHEEAANRIEDYETLFNHERSSNEWAKKRISELESALQEILKPHTYRQVLSIAKGALNSSTGEN